MARRLDRLPAPASTVPLTPALQSPAASDDGVYRVYGNAQGQITGYTWSTVNSSADKKTSAGYTTAMGRIIPAIW